MRGHFKELEKKKELEFQKKKEKENLWEKRLKSKSRKKIRWNGTIRRNCMANLYDGANKEEDGVEEIDKILDKLKLTSERLRKDRRNFL